MLIFGKIEKIPFNTMETIDEINQLTQEYITLEKALKKHAAYLGRCDFNRRAHLKEIQDTIHFRIQGLDNNTKFNINSGLFTKRIQENKINPSFMVKKVEDLKIKKLDGIIKEYNESKGKELECKQLISFKSQLNKFLQEFQDLKENIAKEQQKNQNGNNAKKAGRQQNKEDLLILYPCHKSLLLPKLSKLRNEAHSIIEARLMELSMQENDDLLGLLNPRPTE